MTNPTSNTLGTRILIWGSSCSGKSTLAQQLADHLECPCVDLDTLNWLPDWVGLNATDPERLERRMRQATTGGAWVVAGSYTDNAQNTFWPHLQTIIWLDMPLWLLLYRVFTRTWQRSRSHELLWGTNHENFWDMLKVWRKEESLLWWLVRHYRRKQRQTYDFMADPQWAHIHFIRLSSPAEVDSFLGDLDIRLSSGVGPGTP